LTTAARAARLDATRLRSDSHALRLAVRGNLARSRRRLEKAHVEADRAQARRLEPLPSPWSRLRWTETYDSLDRTLVPVD
jgi:hypothetical protein